MNEQTDLELNELENMAQNLENEQTAQTAEPESAQATGNPEIEAYGLARTVLEIAAKGANAKWPCLNYNEEIKHQGAQVLVPVLIKYNVQNEFLNKWAVEFQAGMFFAGVIFTSWQKVKAYEAEQKAKAKAEQEAKTAANEAATSA